MSFSFDDRVLALAGMAQALQQVRRTAETGQSQSVLLRTAIDSILHIDAPTTEAIYGNAAHLNGGLFLLRDYLLNQGKDALLPRLAVSVMQLERRFVQEPAVVEKVRSGIEHNIALTRARGDSTHPDVLESVGNLYANTISQLKPRIMVQGNPHYLGQAGVVAEIRALLLAAVRSAVLWRQVGGSYWDFLLQKRPMLEAIKRRCG